MFSYEDFISPSLRKFLLDKAKPLFSIPDLLSIGPSGGLENKKSLEFLISLNNILATKLETILNQRILDRKFIDERTKVLYDYNQEAGLETSDEAYKSVLGLEDHNGRIVWGPLQKDYWQKTNHKDIAPLPEFLKGPHVTLFGPPESEKMCINAMNSYHRKLKDEPAIIEELLKTHKSSPKWGADDEDSKTPLREDLISSGENLAQCFTKKIKITSQAEDKKYELAKEKLALPIKRFPGLAIPCSFLFYKGLPLPLHLYDFALHFYKNWNHPEALVFYVPKLENEEEARYIKNMIQAAESLILKEHPEYKVGSVRLMIVLENPRAIFRTHEIIDELDPYFAGASLGWHDFLASTARLFKEDGNYRIPIKADPDIVIKYIKASHELLAKVVGPRGGIKVGGMYGILPLTNDLKSESFQTTIKGYIRDVITQLKRDLDGFWVAHPDFVRIGLAMVEAWKFYKEGNKKPLNNFVEALLLPKYQKEILEFIENPDIESLDPQNTRYARSLIVADLKQSELMANSDTEEIRYNVFQSLQYLTDWLSGNGCVALPAQVGGVAVRVMDDLATAERSRWEVWHEIYHNRISIEEFIKITFEEFNFIRRDLSDTKKIVQVKWNQNSAKWYPVALKIMIKLMTDPNPPEFATELLIPFTIENIRNETDPWNAITQIDPVKYSIGEKPRRFIYYFEKCGHKNWAAQMAQYPVTDFEFGKKLISKFNKSDIIEAAQFHGNIGEAKAVLDSLALKEQSLVVNDNSEIKKELISLSESYLKRFSFKFLISAQGKAPKEILEALKDRLLNSEENEIINAREALWTIAEKRILNEPLSKIQEVFYNSLKKNQVLGAQIALKSAISSIQTLSFGEAKIGSPTRNDNLFEIASLSKSVATAFAIEYFEKKGISLDTSVNEVFSKSSSNFRIKTSNPNLKQYTDQVSIKNLLNHSALNLHYVNGVPANKAMPTISDFLEGNLEYKYPPIELIDSPGKCFHYSGGGFIVLEHLIESLENKHIKDLSKDFLSALGLKNFSFIQKDPSNSSFAHGYKDDGIEVEGAWKMFPAFAAGAVSNANDVLVFLKHLSDAYKNPYGQSPISHDTAVRMLEGKDIGSLEFMGAKMGLGIFIAEAGDNKFMIHQGANDGFRALFLYCFKGPDRDKGIVALCNSEMNGVQFISECTQRFLKDFDFKGINFEKFNDNFQYSNIKEEERVNRGYKELIFDAFEEALPEAILTRGALDPLSPYNKILNSKILSCTNQKFARAENLISPHVPIFDPSLFGKEGKIMDSWESARHSENGREELHLALPSPTYIHFVLISTAYHFGNQVPHIMIEARNSENKQWVNLIPKTTLEGHSIKRIKINHNLFVTYSELRIITIPDGGLSRLQIFDNSLPIKLQSAFQPIELAQCVPCNEIIPHVHKPLSIPVQSSSNVISKLQKNSFHGSINLASFELGAKILSASNQHYGKAENVLSPYRAIHMFDGFESSRSRDLNHHEELIIELARPGIISIIEFDFTYFVNNNPKEIEIYGKTKDSWQLIFEKTNVKAYASNTKVIYLNNRKSISQLKVRVYPDGGINRIRVFEKPKKL